MSRATVAQQLIESHLTSGEFRQGAPISLRINQTLVQDGGGPTVLQELEQLEIDTVRAHTAACYIDHNLLQTDYKHPDDHAYLRSSCRRLGVWFSPAGNGISHPVHLELFGTPGTTLLGADSHTVGGGAVGQLAIGAGGIDVAMAMAGLPYALPCPGVWGIRLEGGFSPGVSAKDLVLELLRRHGVTGALGMILEYHGPGVDQMSVWDRHVVANMGAELGATASVFPSDDQVRSFLEDQGRGKDYVALRAGGDAVYDREDAVDLSTLVPLIARPHSPANVVEVEAVVGTPIGQAYLGSSANPGYRDFAVAAEIVRGRTVAHGVSLDVNPSTRRVLGFLAGEGLLSSLIAAGARLHQSGCNGCVGMGQAPATGVNSIRTTPRNFKGRSGTLDDSVYLASPETVAASAVAGTITDPREYFPTAPVPAPRAYRSTDYLIEAPQPGTVRRGVDVIRGPNIKPLPRFPELPDALVVPVLLRVGDDVSTDDIMPLQQEQAIWRSDTDRVSDFVYCRARPDYVPRARRDGDHCLVAGRNYGQGSAREHAALCPRNLGLRFVIAAGYARIYQRNLVNFGVLPLRIVDESDLAAVEEGDQIAISGLHTALLAEPGLADIAAVVGTAAKPIRLTHDLQADQVQTVMAGGLLPRVRRTLVSSR